MDQSHFEIRRALPEDLDAIVLLLNQLGYTHIESRPLAPIFEAVLKNPNMGVLVARSVNAENTVGFLSYSHKPQLRVVGLLMEIDELVVIENYRGQGVGEILIKRAKEIGQEVGAKIMVLSTNRDRPSYQRGFYLKQGFTEKNSALMILKLTEGN